MRKIKVALFAGIICLVSDASAQTVINGSFEAFTRLFGADGGSQLLPGGTTLTGWTITGGEIAVLRTPNMYGLTASNAINFLDLAGYTNAGFPKGISQVVTALTPGQAYTLAIDIGVGSGIYSGPVQVSASIAGASQTFTHTSVVPGNIWSTFNLNFTAASNSATLSINGISLPSGHTYIGLDNVSISPVPEPSTSGTILLGLAFATLAIRRSRSARRTSIDA